MIDCKDNFDHNERQHKFTFMRNESYWYRSSRYQITFVSNDYFFCEKCLHEEVKTKKQTINDDNRHELQEWAKEIAKHGIDSRY